MIKDKKDYCDIEAGMNLLALRMKAGLDPAKISLYDAQK
jgi:hypothetical protein